MEKVSLYVPCFNARKYLSRCLDGIMRQTYLIDEIIVIDDGSADGTLEVVSDYKSRLNSLRVIRHDMNRGLAYTRNTAVRSAKNEFIASLDADVVPERDWLEKLMENFTDEKIAGAGGMLTEECASSLADEWRAVHMRQHWGSEKIVNPAFLFGSDVVLRKGAIKDAGYYDERFRTNYEDVDLCSRLYKKNYLLIYEPAAAAKHLRKDSTLSVMDAFFRWNAHLQPDCPAFSGFKHSVRLTLQDLLSGRFSLVPIDVMVFLYFLGIRWYMQGNK